MSAPAAMISDAKLAANRANAAQSTGPRTAQGIAASKMNRLSHGLASPLAVLPFEDQAAYDRSLDALIREHRPATPTEEALVKQIADASWRLRRIDNIEAAVFDSILLDELLNGATSAEPYMAIALKLLKTSSHDRVLDLLARYQTTLNRQILAANRELRNMRKPKPRPFGLSPMRPFAERTQLPPDLAEKEAVVMRMLAEETAAVHQLLRREAAIARGETKPRG